MMDAEERARLRERAASMAGYDTIGVANGSETLQLLEDLDAIQADRDDAQRQYEVVLGEINRIWSERDAALVRVAALREALEVHEATIDRIGRLAIGDRSARGIVATLCNILDEHDEVIAATRAALAADDAAAGTSGEPSRESDATG